LASFPKVENIMKFQVRDGFSVQVINKVDMGDGRTEQQASNYYPGQVVDLDAATADQHAHKLEPKDKEAAGFLAAKVVVSPKPESVATADVARMVAEQVAAQMAAIMATMMTPAAPAGDAAKAGA
jgi:hypothetical protein